MIGDIICTIIVVLIVSAMILIAFAMCKAASRYDQISEEQWKEFEIKENKRSVIDNGCEDVS